MEKVEVGDVIEEGPWAGFTLISRYTRAEAIADGVLIDVSERAREAGFTVPVAVTAAVWALVQPTEEEKSHGQVRSRRSVVALLVASLRSGAVAPGHIRATKPGLSRVRVASDPRVGWLTWPDGDHQTTSSSGPPSSSRARDDR
jgi:hypothetical protein